MRQIIIKAYETSLLHSAIPYKPLLDQGTINGVTQIRALLHLIRGSEVVT